MKRLLAIALTVFICIPAGIGFAGAEWTFDIPLSTLTGDTAILVNRDHMLSQGDRPTNLVSVDLRKRTSTVVELDATAAQALESLFSDAAKVTEFVYHVKGDDGSWENVTFSSPDGLELLLVSGYRSYNSQYTIYNNYLARNGGVDDGISSPPGASEHQTGLACDVLSVDYNNNNQYMNSSFYETPEAQWMEENAAAYGFIIRYPEDKEAITKVPYEPWHLRYVGREIAGYIKHTGMALEEFTDLWNAQLDAFLQAGGDEQAQLLLESTMTPAAVTTMVLDIFGEDGDPEISLSMW